MQPWRISPTLCQKSCTVQLPLIFYEIQTWWETFLLHSAPVSHRTWYLSRFSQHANSDILLFYFAEDTCQVEKEKDNLEDVLMITISLGFLNVCIFVTKASWSEHLPLIRITDIGFLQVQSVKWSAMRASFINIKIPGYWSTPLLPTLLYSYSFPDRFFMYIKHEQLYFVFVTTHFLASHAEAR